MLSYRINFMSRRHSISTAVNRDCSADDLQTTKRANTRSTCLMLDLMTMLSPDTPC
jgi:hypothetical protein